MCSWGVGWGEQRQAISSLPYKPPLSGTVPLHITAVPLAPIPVAIMPLLLPDTNVSPNSNLQANALQQFMQSLGLGPLAFALSAAGAHGPHSLLGQHVHIDEFERAQLAIEEAQPCAHRWLFYDLDNISFL